MTVPFNIVAKSAALLNDPEFWVGVAFVLVLIFLAVPIFRILKKLITKRIIRIKTELQEAEKLKLDAQKVYAEYERKLQNVDNEVDEIKSEQNFLIKNMKNHKLQKLEDILKQKKNEADEHLKIAIQKANLEINELISQKSIEVLRNIISSKMTKKDYNNLIDASIEHIKNL